VTQSNPESNQAARAAGLVGQIGCTTGFASIVIIGIAFALGRLLDSLVGTNGIFTVLLLVGSFPITLYVIVRISMWTLTRSQIIEPTSQAENLQTETTSKEEAE
jgi:F0F1-type ATP synthase assembly protein I